MKIAFVVNVDWFFVSHRLPIAKRAIAEGNEVWVISKDTGKRDMLEKMGVHFIDFPLERSSLNPFHEIKCVYGLYKIFKKEQFDIIHNITLKVSALSSFATKYMKEQHVVNAISGLGYAFTDGRKSFVARLSKMVAKFAFSGSGNYFIFQNQDDADVFKSIGISDQNNIFLVKGSGVDIREYSYCEPDREEHVIKYLLPARILRDKGVIEYIAAARILKSELFGKAKFIMAGQCDKENRASIPESEIHGVEIPGYIEWIGNQNNMVPIYKDCDVVVLPSYREGLPKSLIEACAIGRPIITTIVPGCKECVIEGVNGLMVPAKNSVALADAIRTLFADPSKRLSMGKEARKLAEKEFSIDLVLEKHFEIYQKMLNNKSFFE